jgi:hypothetical protein
MLSNHFNKNDGLIGRNQLPLEENWTLDRKFFKDLESWKKQHPDSTLLKVMERVNDAVTQGNNFIDFIPDAPFPARSLVKALGYLLLLGVVSISSFWIIQVIYLFLGIKTIGRAKDEVFAFTKEVITWLSTIEASLGDMKAGKFMVLAHDNLDHIRYVTVRIAPMRRH